MLNYSAILNFQELQLFPCNFYFYPFWQIIIILNSPAIWNFYTWQHFLVVFPSQTPEKYSKTERVDTWQYTIQYTMQNTRSVIAVFFVFLK
jgi:hypothetical protein